MNAPSIYKSPEGEKEIRSFYEYILQRYPVPHDEITVPTRYGNTFIIACGDPASPPLMLLHGTATNSAMWMGDIPKLCARYRVYSVDIIGEPGKSDGNRPDLAGPAHVEWMDDILHHFSINSIFMAGNSLGGWMAMKYATARPDKVKKLALLAPSGLAPARISFLFKSALFVMAGKGGLARINRIVFHKQKVTEEAERFGELVFLHYRYRLKPIPQFTDKELSRLTMRVLFLAGDRDALLPSVRSAQRLSRFVPHASVSVLPDTGHVLINQVESLIRFFETE